VQAQRRRPGTPHAARLAPGSSVPDPVIRFALECWPSAD
jgi:hypothetical protein